MVATTDVAILYNSKAKIINQVVKRNINRFPDNFCFQLTYQEFVSLRSQNVTSSLRNEIVHGGIRYLPYVFTEHGIIMLSGLLKSDIAIEVNVIVINAFVSLRKYVSTNLIEQRYINKLVLEHEERIKIIEDTFSSFKEKNNHIFFEGGIMMNILLC